MDAMPIRSRIDLVDSLAKASHQQSANNKVEVGSFKKYFKSTPKQKKRDRPRKQKYWQTAQKEKRREEVSMSKEK